MRTSKIFFVFIAILNLSVVSFAGEMAVELSELPGRVETIKSSCNPFKEQPPVACSGVAGRYSIPADNTAGVATWKKDKCGNIKYTGGCTRPKLKPK
jgi:hypothetical protein